MPGAPPLAPEDEPVNIVTFTEEDGRTTLSRARADHEQGAARHDRRLRDGGRHAGVDGRPRGGRCLARLKSGQRRGMASTITALESSDVRFPTSEPARRLRRGQRRPGLLRRVRDPPHRRARRARGPRLRLHHRPRHRGPGRGHRRDGAARGRARPRRGRSPTPRAFSRRLTGDSQLRWLGPEKGVVHMAAAAVINAVWDLYAKREGVPLWQLLARMSPEEIVALVDFRYLTDALTPEEALALLREREPGRAERERALLADGLRGLHDLAGLARLRRRQAAPADRRGARRGLHARQAQGRRRPRGRHAPLRDRARRARRRGRS